MNALLIRSLRKMVWGAIAALVILVGPAPPARADFTYTTYISVRNVSVSGQVKYECWVVPKGRRDFIYLGALWAEPGKTATFKKDGAVEKSTNYWIEIRETPWPSGRPSNLYRWQEIEWESRVKVVPWSTPGLGSGSDTHHYLTVKSLPAR